MEEPFFYHYEPFSYHLRAIFLSPTLEAHLTTKEASDAVRNHLNRSGGVELPRKHLPGVPKITNHRRRVMEWRSHFFRTRAIFFSLAPFFSHSRHFFLTWRCVSSHFFITCSMTAQIATMAVFDAGDLYRRRRHLLPGRMAKNSIAVAVAAAIVVTSPVSSFSYAFLLLPLRYTLKLLLQFNNNNISSRSSNNKILSVKAHSLAMVVGCLLPFVVGGRFLVVDAGCAAPWSHACLPLVHRTLFSSSLLESTY